MKHYRYDDPNRCVYPFKNTQYNKVGKKWIPVSVNENFISEKEAKRLFRWGGKGIIGEKYHRFSISNPKYAYMQKPDTLTSVSPDGNCKSVWYCDFPEGEKKMRRIRDKHDYDCERYKLRRIMY